MYKPIRSNKTMFLFKKRIIQVFFLIPALIIGLILIPVSYAEKINSDFAKSSYGPVTSSDTLGKIVSRNYSGSSLTTQQIMTGILRANPEAFIGGNIHYLLKGSTLLLPKENLIATIKHSDAQKLIREHYRYFQRGKTGNFEIAPLVDSNNHTGNDRRSFEKDAALILSNETNKTDSPTLNSGTIAKKEKKQEATKKNTQSQSEKTIKQSQVDHSVKDIELETLKIKIARLEKILSSRGISSSGIANIATKEIKDTLRAQKEKIDQLEHEKTNKNSQLDQLKNKISELEISLKKMTKSLSDKDNLALSSGSEKNALVTQLKKDNTGLEKKLNLLQLELDQKIAEVTLLTSEIKTAKNTINQLEAKLIDRDKENTKLDQQIAEMEAKLAEIRQEPARNLNINNTTSHTNSALSFAKSPWIWLLPALFLLSILAYLFKRSFSQPKKVQVNHTAETTESKQKQPAEETFAHTTSKKLTKETTPKKVSPSPVPDIISSANEEESVESSIKLDIAKAYMDMDMQDAAIEILQEAHQEGSNKQRLEAKNLLEKLS